MPKFDDVSLETYMSPQSNCAYAQTTLARTDLLCMLNWGTQWTMVSYLKK